MQRHGCFALWKLAAGHAGNRAAAEAAGAARAVAAALDSHRESEVLVRVSGGLAQKCLVEGHAG